VITLFRVSLESHVEVENPVVLITGAAKRFGRTVAVELCRKGYHVIAHYNTSAVEAKALKQEMTEAGLLLDLIKCDLSQLADVQSVDRFLCEVSDRHGRCFALINNASIFEYDHPEALQTDMLQRSLQVNLTAPVLLMDRFLSLATRSPQQRTPIVINVLDAKVKQLNPDYLSYTLGKVGLAAACSMYAMHYGAHAKVYGVAPSMFLESGAVTSGRVEELTQMNLLKRPVLEADICSSVEFLLQGIAATGEVIVVDGGQIHMKLARDVAFLQ
jgi:NAD(P)-dependent dehydrogenase (short-subunit alcohol dehydrogenase family)